MAYATDPIGTIMTNVLGTYNILDFACTHKTKRTLFASSVEVYGENRGDVEQFTEDYCGYINSNTLRAGYPESKRCGEALCQAYIQKKDLNVIIPRLARCYGPNVLTSDSRAISQFIKKGVANEDIVLKSKGDQLYSYIYVTDVVSGLLTLLLLGKSGEAYNIAADSSTLKDLAQMVADTVGRQVISRAPDGVEAAGYGKVTSAQLDTSKLKALGWTPKYGIEDGIKRTIAILKGIRNHEA